MKHLTLVLLCALLIVCISSCNMADQKHQQGNITAVTDSIKVKLELVTNAVNLPVQISTAPDGTHRLFISELAGKIWILKNDSLQPKPFLDIATKLEQKDSSAESRGMFSMVFHPQFSANRKFYVCYNAPTNIDTNICKFVVSEFTANANDPDVADINSERRVFEIEGKGAERLAAGLAFGPDGYLYIGISDHGDSTYTHLAQDMSAFNGKLLRIDIDQTPYGIPADNPFVGVKNVRPEIWASGFRRLWRFSFDPQTKQLFAGDVGESKDEEVDIIKKGGNYGWPVMEGDSTYNGKQIISNTAYKQPINAYAHDEGICIIGGDFYYGDAAPELKNKYVFADFNGNLFALVKNEQQTWARQQLKVLNTPSDPFLIFGFNSIDNNELYVMGILNTSTGGKGVVYKILQ